MFKITPFLWFPKNIHPILVYYKTIFPELISDPLEKYEETPSGSIEFANIKIYDRELLIMAADDTSKFNNSISMTIWCNNLERTKYIWEQLSSTGKVLMNADKYDWSEYYGWCNDKYGLSWQIMYYPDSENMVIPSITMSGANCGKAAEFIENLKPIFKDISINHISKYGKNENGDNPEHIAHCEFTVNNQKYIIMDSSNMHDQNFNESISFLILCKGQDEVDFYWDKIIANGGEASQCAWCKDKFGISWQVVPEELNQATGNPDPVIAKYALESMLQMSKIIINDLYQK